MGLVKEIDSVSAARPDFQVFGASWRVVDAPTASGSWNQLAFDFGFELRDRSARAATAAAESFDRNRISQNFVNEFNIFDAIKGDSSGSVGELSFPLKRSG